MFSSNAVKLYVVHKLFLPLESESAKYTMNTEPEANVIQILQAAACQNVVLVKQAEAQLKILELKPGFYSTLLVRIKSLSVLLLFFSLLIYCTIILI